MAVAYELPGEPSEIQAYRRHGHVYLLTVGDRQYVAKMGIDWSDQDIRFKLGVQTYLHDIGYPISKLHSTCKGELLWDPSGVGSILMDHVGQPLDPSRRRQQSGAAATTLGRFHREGPKAKGLGTCYWNDWDPEFQYSKAFNQNAYDFLRGKALSESKRRFVTECIDEMAELLNRASSLLIAKNWFDLPHIPIHGEYHQYHCRYDGDQVAAVIDWDTARLAPRLQELCRALNVGIGWGAPILDNDNYRWQWMGVPSVGDVADWMNHYRESAPPLSLDETELLPYVCVGMWPQSGGSQVPSCDEEVEGCDRVVQFMRFWFDEAEAVRDALMQQ